MSIEFPKVSGLQLTPQDLHALGAVVAQWAIAEHFITSHVHHLTQLTVNPRVHRMKWRTEFGRMQSQWKELLKDVCANTEEYLDIGIRLAGAAKVLKEDRNAAAHWPASRDGFRLDVVPKFVQINLQDGTFQKRQKNFTPAHLIELSERIYQLGSDVNFFNFALTCDLFPSLCTWHGPKPEGPILRTRSIPTIEKPLHPRPTSRT